MSRNPFGVQDVPDPDGDDVAAFARGVRPTAPAGAAPESLEGRWSSGTRVHILRCIGDVAGASPGERI